MEKDIYTRAFPSQGTDGMTLRDYFAAAALQGILAADLAEGEPAAEIAAYVYELADAMMAERRR